MYIPSSKRASACDSNREKSGRGSYTEQMNRASKRRGDMDRIWWRYIQASKRQRSGMNRISMRFEHQGGKSISVILWPISQKECTIMWRNPAFSEKGAISEAKWKWGGENTLPQKNGYHPKLSYNAWAWCACLAWLGTRVLSRPYTVNYRISKSMFYWKYNWIHWVACSIIA